MTLSTLQERRRRRQTHYRSTTLVVVRVSSIGMITLVLLQLLGGTKVLVPSSWSMMDGTVVDLAKNIVPSNHYHPSSTILSLRRHDDESWNNTTNNSSKRPRLICIDKYLSSVQDACRFRTFANDHHHDHHPWNTTTRRVVVPTMSHVKDDPPANDVMGSPIVEQMAYYDRWPQWQDNDPNNNNNNHHGHVLVNCTLRPTWHRQTYSTCNSLHERVSSVDYLRSLYRAKETRATPLEESSTTRTWLGQGYWRDCWKIPAIEEEEDRSSTSTDTVALKLLRFERDMRPMVWKQHRAEALAMERLTGRPDIVSAFAFCGNSIITEFVSTTLGDSIHQKDDDTTSNVASSCREKLQLGRDIARALAAVHSVNDTHSVFDSHDDVTRSSDDHPTLVHADFHPHNLFLVPRGHTVNRTIDSAWQIKLNDFNQARLIPWDVATATPCRHAKSALNRLYRFAKPPEQLEHYQKQYIHLDKLDVYRLGNVLYEFYYSKQPHHNTTIREGDFYHANVASEDERSFVHIPSLADIQAPTSSLCDKVFVYAILACMIATPEYRPTAASVAKAFDVALQWDLEGSSKTIRDVKGLFNTEETTLFA